MRCFSRRVFWGLGLSLCAWCWQSSQLFGQTPLSDESLRTFGLKSAQPREPAPVITAVAINADGTLLATAGDDHMVNLWNVDDGKLAHALHGHADWIRAIAFSPDGKTLATAGDDRTIRLWDAVSGKLIRAFGQHETAIYALQFHPDGNSVAAAGFENAVRVYEVQTGNRSREFHCTCSDVRAIAFSPDGKTLVGGGRDGCLCMWNYDDGSVKQHCQAHGQRIRALAFSPDGRWLAYESDDSGRYEAYVQRISGGVLSAAEKFQVSREGGVQPVWRADGKEFLYRQMVEPGGADELQLMAADVATTPTFQPGTPKALFKIPGIYRGNLGNISRDGQRLVFAMDVPADAPAR
jgi:WD40 repeat protein